MIELIKGNFYKNGNKTYLIGGNVPYISNRWILRVYKNNVLMEDLDYTCLYYIQDDNFKLLKKEFKFDAKYKDALIRLMCNDYHRTPLNRMPNVDHLLK